MPFGPAANKTQQQDHSQPHIRKYSPHLKQNPQPTDVNLTP